MVFGLSFVIASACVFNNYIDRGIDEKMSRTKKRALVTKMISEKNALIYGTILGIVGSSLLLFFTNILTAFIAFVGFFFYLVMYGIWKRRSELGTVVGSISGAVPPVVGYCAVSNHFDLAALLLFAILVFWQMPHFYAIAIFRKEDYAAAAIPVLPLKKGLFHTKIQMFLYVVAFIVSVSLLTVFHYTGYAYLIIVGLVSLVWLGISIRGFRVSDDKRWARSMFFVSILLILVFSFMLSVNAVLP